METKLSVWQEHGPALEIPVLLIQKTGWFLALARSKVEVSHLIALAVEEDVGVPVHQCAVLVVVEVLPPDRITFDVF